VWHVLRDLSTDTLIRVVAGIETRMIDGNAHADDIDTYVLAQLEIAERTMGRAAAAGDDTNPGHGPVKEGPRR